MESLEPAFTFKGILSLIGKFDKIKVNQNEKNIL